MKDRDEPILTGQDMERLAAMTPEELERMDPALGARLEAFKRQLRPMGKRPFQLPPSQAFNPYFDDAVPHCELDDEHGTLQIESRKRFYARMLRQFTAKFQRYWNNLPLTREFNVVRDITASHLVDVLGKTQGQVCREMGMTPGQLRKALARARRFANRDGRTSKTFKGKTK